MSIIDKLRNKPKARQKQQVKVGVRGAPKEQVKIKTKIVNKLKEGLIPDRNTVLEKFRSSKAIVAKVDKEDSAPVSQRPPSPPKAKPSISSSTKKPTG